MASTALPEARSWIITLSLPHVNKSLGAVASRPFRDPSHALTFC